jgi:hypothetical protein
MVHEGNYISARDEQGKEIFPSCFDDRMMGRAFLSPWSLAVIIGLSVAGPTLRN